MLLEAKLKFLVGKFVFQVDSSVSAHALFYTDGLQCYRVIYKTEMKVEVLAQKLGPITSIKYYKT